MSQMSSHKETWRRPSLRRLNIWHSPSERDRFRVKHAWNVVKNGSETWAMLWTGRWTMCRETKQLIKVAVKVKPHPQRHFTQRLNSESALNSPVPRVLSSFFWSDVFTLGRLVAALKDVMIDSSCVFITGGVHKKSTTKLPPVHESRSSPLTW